MADVMNFNMMFSKFLSSPAVLVRLCLTKPRLVLTRRMNGNWSTERLPTDLTGFQRRSVREFLKRVKVQAEGGAHRQKAVQMGALSDQHHAQRDDEIRGR
jgi:hypothetical protein